MSMCSSSEIVVDSLYVGLYLVSKLVEIFKDGLAVDGSEAGSLEEGVLVIGRDFHGV